MNITRRDTIKSILAAAAVAVAPAPLNALTISPNSTKTDSFVEDINYLLLRLAECRNCRFNYQNDRIVIFVPRDSDLDGIKERFFHDHPDANDDCVYLSSLYKIPKLSVGINEKKDAPKFKGIWGEVSYLENGERAFLLTGPKFNMAFIQKQPK